MLKYSFSMRATNQVGITRDIKTIVQYQLKWIQGKWVCLMCKQLTYSNENHFYIICVLWKSSFPFMYMWAVHNLAHVLHTIQCFMGGTCMCAWTTISAIFTSFQWCNLPAHNLLVTPKPPKPLLRLSSLSTIYFVVSLYSCMMMSIWSPVEYL